MMECGRGAGQSEIFASNAPVVKEGRMTVSVLPGIGFVFNVEYLKKNLAEGETWWG